MREMNHKCEYNGCFLERHVLKFGVFDGIFPRGINFCDIDATVEYNYQFLEMEWKADRALFDKCKGQMMYIKRKTRALRLTFMLVVGNAETMAVSEYKVIYNGAVSGWIPSDMDGLKRRIAQWRDYVDREPKSQLQHPVKSK